jgi:hypothetical protein
MTTLLFAFSLLSGLATAVAFVGSPVPFWLPALVAAGLAGYIGAAATKSWRTEFPKELTTLGEFARWIMTHKPGLASAGTTTWTRDQVSARVRAIVVESLGCASTYREDACFIQDLGLS